ELLERTADAFAAFHETVGTGGAEVLERGPVIFEGAQGLALDMDGPNFPHVTRSNTGLTNVIPIAEALGLALDVVYVTRTYATKRGAGPLPGELAAPPPEWVDRTNTPHPYQGVLRYAPLDTIALMKRVANDQRLARRDDTFTYALTHVD